MKKILTIVMNAEMQMIPRDEFMMFVISVVVGVIFFAEKYSIILRIKIVTKSKRLKTSLSIYCEQDNK